MTNYQGKDAYIFELIHAADQRNKINDLYDFLNQTYPDIFLDIKPLLSRPGRYYVAQSDIDLLAKIEQLLLTHRYAEALDYIEPELKADTPNAKLRVFWVLAKLGGRNPNKLNNEDLLRCFQENLAVAASDEDLKSIALLVMAIVNNDYFDENGFGYDFAPIDDIARQLSDKPISQAFVPLINDLRPSRYVKMKFPRVFGGDVR